ncbi:MAG: glycosyltransferase family 2 protein [Lachnospiraceae bacterium]|nr:glycosyltransferase family 2 protein [Lachnospiraceae bacterium]
MVSTEICFVILHYNTLEDTQNCVESIKRNIDTNSYEIVIVDNASPNKSGIKLQEILKNEDKCHVICNENNLGFAQGNNVGIKFAVGELGAKFVCCLNNDTILVDKAFFKKVLKNYKRTNFGLLGPRIIDRSGKTQYYNGKIYPIEEYRMVLEKLLNLPDGQYDLPKANIKNFSVKQKIVFYLKNNIIVEALRRVKNNPYYKKHNVVLHGCCIVFSPLFLNEYEGFYPKTFLYHEEQLLFLQARKKEITTLYTPDICIKHLEDSATNSICNGNEEKKKFLLKHRIKSLKVLIAYMEER